MKKLITLFLVFSASAHAGTAKLTWSHNGQSFDGSPVTITQFNVYWGVQGTGLTNIIPLGPPAPTPWRIDNGVSTWSRTLNRNEWQPGMTICFQMTALAQTEESGRSNVVCKTFPESPDEPIIIDIDRP